MDQNEITMEMDVKMDLKEKKMEYFELRTWNKCTVKVEAVKYIPCFVKITLILNNNEKSNIVIKISIPGLSVQLAESRSKAYSYGLFWTQHRKNCCMFFALDSKIKLEQHIKWVQNSIINLELHRREMLELRRASRISKNDDSISRSLNASVDVTSPVPRSNETQDIRDINDILGPLPKVPDSNMHWSRRTSATSEIYEEIGDGELLNRNMSRKLSRTSIASGIYEVMTSPLVSIEEIPPVLEEMPPPLPPPRPRVNTQTEINRAYTNPESISSKKRKRNIFETVFSRHKSMQKRKSPKPKEQSAKLESPMIELIRSHRMSYSSPDLSKVDINHYANEFETDLMARSSATEFSIRNEHSFLNSTTSSETQEFDDVDGNISANILSTFNISCNESTVNLVGSKLNGNRQTTAVATVIDDVSGYCQMAPIIRSDPAISPVALPELPPKSPSIAANTKQHQIPVNVTKTITFCRDYTMEASIHNFENLKISKENSQSSQKNTKITESPSLTHQVKCKISALSPESCKKINDSFDEKYPSYYPNDVPKTPAKDFRKNGGINYLTKGENTPERTENLYIATPRHGTGTHRTSPSNQSTKNLVILSPTNSLVSSNNSHLLTPSIKSSISDTISSASPLLFHKYATVTPLKKGDAGSCKKSSDIGSSTKRFSSLPRFKKIDFSPLKLKFNSVLQRQTPDQM